MRVLITSILILLSALSGTCQSIEGLWLQDYVQEVRIEDDSLTSVNETKDSLLIQLDSLLMNIDTPKIDTFYHTVINPYYFNTNGQLYSIRDTGNYVLRNDSIFITIKEDTFKGYKQGQELTLNYDHKTSGHFFKYNYNSLEVPENAFKSSWWKIFEGENELFSVEFDNGNGGTLKRFDWYGSTSELFKNFIIFRGIPFLALTDWNVLDSHILVITNYSQGNFEALYYHPDPYDKVPEQMHVIGRKMDYKAVDLETIRSNLIGNWNTKDLGNLGAYMSDYDTLINTFCNLQLLDDMTFEIRYGGDLVKDNENHFVEKQISGEWDLGKTGEYIIASYLVEDNFSDDFKEVSRYYSMLKLNSDSLHINAELYSLDIEDVISNVYLEMTKQR